MDQVKSLINKLVLAADNGADRLNILAIVEELRHQLTQQMVTAPVPKSSVSVWMPNGFAPTSPVASAPNEVAKAAFKDEVFVKPIGVPRPPAVVIVQEKPVEQPEFEKPLAPIVEAPLSAKNEIFDAETNTVIAEPLAELSSAEPSHFELKLSNEMLKEIDLILNGEANTKPEQNSNGHTKELNEKVAERTKVLNEVFDRKQPELAEVLAEPKIADIRKAISINEKYQYINSLFRGDEDRYERSIRTLNNFSIWPEADYWVQRELMIKLGWNDEDELVQKFYSLVRRRFF